MYSLSDEVFIYLFTYLLPYLATTQPNRVGCYTGVISPHVISARIQQFATPKARRFVRAGYCRIVNTGSVRVLDIKKELSVHIFCFSILYYFLLFSLLSSFFFLLRNGRMAS